MATFTWDVSQTNYEVLNGFIITAHWEHPTLPKSTDTQLN